MNLILIGILILVLVVTFRGYRKFFSSDEQLFKKTVDKELTKLQGETDIYPWIESFDRLVATKYVLQDADLIVRCMSKHISQIIILGSVMIDRSKKQGSGKNIEQLKELKRATQVFLNKTHFNLSSQHFKKMLDEITLPRSA